MDLRDENTVKSALFHQLLDWDGHDLKTVYEPFSQQIGYIFTFILVFLLGYIARRVFRKWNRNRKERPKPYSVIKTPSLVIKEAQTSGKRKRIVAVVGGTGFVGSHVVEELLSRGDCYVYLLGRRCSSVDEEIRSRVDALIQVDLMDYDGLVKAFQGVDSVINAAAAVPTVFSTIDSIWRINKVGTENVIAAAQESGVKQLVFVSGIRMECPPGYPMTKALMNCFILMEDAVLRANGKKGLATCVCAFSQIYGVNNYYKMFLKGEMSRFPLVDEYASFSPVEYVASVVLLAEQQLIQNNDKVSGKLLSIVGWASTFKEFFTLAEWGHPPLAHMSPATLTFLAKMNTFVASVTGWAPMGADFTSVISSFFFMKEPKMDNSVIEEALGIGPVPNVRDGVQKLAEKFKKKENDKKKR